MLNAGAAIYSAKGARPVDADAQRIAAEVALAGAAIAAAAAGDLTFSRDPVADFHFGMFGMDLRPDFDDFAGEFVTDRHRHRDRFPSPCVPVIDMNIGAADRGGLTLISTSFGPIAGRATCHIECLPRALL
ncbi:MAG: hypothetical protein R3C40_05280 [Parvularculaceae bacterium]